MKKMDNNKSENFSFLTTELTKDCQEKMKKDWDRFSECLTKLGEDINNDNYMERCKRLSDGAGVTL